MTSEIKTFGKIDELDKVQEYFGLENDTNWLNVINHAISPTGEFIALAQAEKIVFLSSYWNTTNGNGYAMSWRAVLENSNHVITSLVCLPMCARSANSGIEWTCVAVGSNSGTITFYTDTGIKLFSQCCQEDAILGIKIHTPPRYSEADPLLYIIYEQCICIIKGADVFPLLTNIRQNIVRAFKRSQFETPVQTLDVIPFHKYKYTRDNQTVINDAVISNTTRSHVYDHIVAQSVSYGYYAKVGSIPPQSSQIIAIGAEPYLGFYHAEEGYKIATLGEVAKDVIGMAYKNIIGNLFRRSPDEPQASDDDQLLPTKEAQMRTRCRLYDGKRDGYSVILSPAGNLAAVADNLERVVLVDTRRAVILRTWKGYRNAQCAFVPVKERSLKGIKTHRRVALFLVIYAQRLGCLDIWALQNGPKVASFKVCKNGQLFYNTHGLLGPASTHSSSSLKSVKSSINYCLFFDPNDATIKEVLIPFHYALSETNSKTSRDIHMLRKLRNSLRDFDNDVEKSTQLASELETIEIQQQCLEMLLKNKQLRPQTFQCIMDAFTKKFANIDEALMRNEAARQFRQQVTNYKRLADFYMALKTPKTKHHDVMDELELHELDLVTITQLVKLLSEHKKKREVTFNAQCNEFSDFIDFLELFDVEKVAELRLLRDKSDNYGSVSNKLFAAYFANGFCFEDFKHTVLESRIPCADLLILALHFWLDKPFDYVNYDEAIPDMSRLAAIIRAICNIEGDHINDYAYNAISPWWQAVREILLESPKSSGLLVAIVCKTVAIELWKRNREGSCDESSQTEEDECWERISHDEAQWGLLIGKLEDVAILGAVLEHPIQGDQPIGPAIQYELPDCSLRAIVQGGKGIITDLTAKWLISTRIRPAFIAETCNSEDHIKIKEKTKNGKVENKNENEVKSDTKTNTLDSKSMIALSDPLLEKLALLRAHFPFSLESGPLLTMMTWHYMIHWSKNLSSLQYMRAAIACLKQFKRADWALKHGICSMVWKSTLKYPLQSTMKLMQKVGRLPVDKMCQQDIDMSAGLVPNFLELILEFLEQFASCLEHEERELKFEESLNEGPTPLPVLTLQQHNAIKELLQLQHEVCTVLYFIAYFQLKHTRPLTSLFDAMANKALLADINKELPYKLTAPDMVLQERRIDFLCTVVTETIDLIREDLQQLFIEDHVCYMTKIFALAKLWQLDKLPIIRRQIVGLYAFGYDTEAEVLVEKTENDELLGCQLLEIAGRRLNLYTSLSSEKFLAIASIGQQLLQYLDKLKELGSEQSIQISATKPEEIDINALSKLLTHIYKCLCRRDTKYLHVTGQMYDACQLLLSESY